MGAFCIYGKPDKQAIKSRKLDLLVGKLFMYSNWIFSIDQDLCRWSPHICERVLLRPSLSLPASNLFPSLGKFTMRHVWTLTTLYWLCCALTTSKTMVLIREVMCLVFWIFLYLFGCIFVYLCFLEFVKAREWQRHQGGRQGETWR